MRVLIGNTDPLYCDLRAGKTRQDKARLAVRTFTAGIRSALDA